MVASAFSYIGDGVPRQSRLWRRAGAVTVLALSLGGCAVASLPFAEMNADRMAARTTTTAAPAVVKVAATQGVDPSDWETVRRTVAGAAVEEVVDRLHWSNPDTGSTGTIADLGEAVDRSGTICRPFATTVSDLRGVRRYRGQACQRADGRWQLYGVTADDATLS